VLALPVNHTWQNPKRLGFMLGFFTVLGFYTSNNPKRTNILGFFSKTSVNTKILGLFL
jgi:hypothetical protein